ncbi:ACP S-malonyltransferase [Teredinibacter haidensis]|uniref:ACP S-malonyltransferase n=1 Tax=Teredinibacter haidensis TaxID=2731755 RepID=UPI0009488CFE|nr:ACP S-malonyltransferase [Teredinibacter haidensis]
MKTAYVFPGQGSQFLGMGAEYFDRFPELVKMADSMLGYSIKELCLDDPKKCLNKTDFTQPALYTVNALTYAAKIEDSSIKPDVVAGHSLGEYNALLAAGAFDFSTGLKIVQKRGELMAKADQGGMLAVLGIDIQKVETILRSLNNKNIQVANINSAKQTILSGDKAALLESTSVFEKSGARVVPLNVSAAFHSTYMNDAREEFSLYLRGFQFRSLEIPVIENLTAELYPEIRYETQLANQITGSVRWHDTVIWMIKNGYENIEEVGPGLVLTKLTSIIKNDLSEVSQKEETIPTAENNLLFMYGGQGFHYLGMGHELFETQNVFRKTMMQCDSMVNDILGVSIVHEFYEKDPEEVDVENILITHPAIYSFGYCLTKELESQGLRPAAVMGYSLGEYVAATIAGSITFNEGLTLVCKQAQLLKQHARDGSMLAVLADVKDYNMHLDDYANVTMGCINYNDNFIVSGKKNEILATKRRLESRGVLSLVLPVAHSFHSHHIETIKEPFTKIVDNIEMSAPNIRMYSPIKSGHLSDVDSEHLWKAIREQVNFNGIAGVLKESGEYRFVDLSPTASLASFLDRRFGKHEDHHYAVNQFGKNRDTLNKMVSVISGTT